MANVFLSYAREDREVAQMVAAVLERHGWSVFWDTSLLAGEQFREVIREQLRTSTCVVVLWSKDSATSRWVLDEARRGAERSVLVPARLDDHAIPLGFGESHTADLVGWVGRDDHPGLRQLVAGVARHVGGSHAPQPNERAEPARVQVQRRASSSSRKGSFVAIIVTAVVAIAAVAIGVQLFGQEEVPVPSTTAPDTTPPRVAPPGGCRVEVSNPLATIREQPDVFGQEIIRVPAGTYAVVEIQVVTTPVAEQRWFKLEVDGRSGWLRDSTFDIASKSAECP